MTEETTTLTRIDSGGGLYPGLNMPEVYKFCETVVESRLVPATSAPQALVVILAGREYGLSPMAALMNGHMIKGKFTLSADMIAAIATRRGATIELIETTAERAIYRFGGAGRTTPINFEYSIDDAKRAGLLRKSDSNWDKHPKAMLRARAVSQGVRAAFPGMMAGAYLPEEMDEVIDTTSTPITPSLKDALAKSEPAPEIASENQAGAVRRLALASATTATTYADGPKTDLQTPPDEPETHDVEPEGPISKPPEIAKAIGVRKAARECKAMEEQLSIGARKEARTAAMVPDLSKSIKSTWPPEDLDRLHQTLSGLVDALSALEATGDDETPPTATDDVRDALVGHIAKLETEISDELYSELREVMDIPTGPDALLTADLDDLRELKRRLVEKGGVL